MASKPSPRHMLAGLPRFLAAVAVITGIGLGITAVAIALYPSVIQPIRLPMGTPILILGAIAVATYFIMGAAIAVFAKKFLS